MKILPNGIAILENDSHLGKWIEESGRLDHDQNMLPVILPYIKEGDVVVDAGAFIGDHTIAYLKAVGPTGVVHAFEPNYHAFQCLKINCPTATNYQIGLSHKPGFMEITELDNKGASFGTDVNDFAFGKENYVLTEKLDYFNLGRVNFFKLDIEGMELGAIHGARYTILRCRPIILCEINESALKRNQTSGLELIEKIESLGYSKNKVYENDTLDAPMFDLLFLPK